MQIQQLLPLVRQLHNQLRDAVVMTCEKSSLENLSTVEYEGADDTIYSIDAVCERELIEIGSKEIALHVPIVLIAEGLKNGKMVLPEGAKESEAKYRMIVDPIDGTRGLMYQKRSAWILTELPRIVAKTLHCRIFNLPSKQKFHWLNSTCRINSGRFEAMACMPFDTTV